MINDFSSKRFVNISDLLLPTPHDVMNSACFSE